MPLPPPPAPGPLVVAFLDAGQGDCTLVAFPNGKLMLVDCGSIKNSGTVSPQIVLALNRFLPRNHNTIDWLVVAHPDQDHYNMLRTVLGGVANVTNVMYGGDVGLYRNQRDGPNWTYDYLLRRGTPFGASYFGGVSPLFTCDEVNVYVLAANATGDPAAADGWSSNTNSVVLLLEYPTNNGTYKVFLMADATTGTEDFIRTTSPTCLTSPRDC
jgi:hypothetical protein